MTPLDEFRRLSHDESSAFHIPFPCWGRGPVSYCLSDWDRSIASICLGELYNQSLLVFAEGLRQSYGKEPTPSDARRRGIRSDKAADLSHRPAGEAVYISLSKLGLLIGMTKQCILKVYRFNGIGSGYRSAELVNYLERALPPTYKSICRGSHIPII
jgi:hypothetical protein